MGIGVLWYDFLEQSVTDFCPSLGALLETDAQRGY